MIFMVTMSMDITMCHFVVIIAALMESMLRIIWMAEALVVDMNAFTLPEGHQIFNRINPCMNELEKTSLLAGRIKVITSKA